MGILFVLALWAIIGIIVAGIGSLVLSGIAAFFTRGVATGRRRTLLAVSLYPFACLGWAASVFVFQAVINEVVFHRDPGLGDTWECPLPNGYVLLMIDVTDDGTVYNPKTQPIADGVVSQEDSISGVRSAQVAGRYILGAFDSRSSEHPFDHKEVDSYFLLDTRTGTRSEFATPDALRDSAGKLQIELNLEPFNLVYSHYRYTWFDVFAALLLCIPPLLSGGVLLWWILRLRRSAANI